MQLLLESIKPFVRQGLIRAILGTGYNKVNLKTRDSRLFCVLSGSGSIVINGEAHQLTVGSLVLF